MRNFILSTCGTSLLTHFATQDVRELLNKYANHNEDEIEPQIRKKLLEHIESCKKQLFEMRTEEVYEVSAELNALLRLYDFQLQNHRDHHVLLTTDTFLGEQTGRIIEEWLRKENGAFSVMPFKQKDLQTNSLVRFQWALADLVKMIDQWVNDFRNKKYRIIFNLTGGFKSVQGYLQTLAMFYADETLYVFETEKELFRLPRIPIKLATHEMIQNHFTVFRKLDLNLKIEAPDSENISELMLLKIDNEYCLSEYGQLVYNQAKKELYRQKIWPSPYHKLKFGPKFLKSTENLDGERKCMVNERIDDLVDYLVNQRKKSRLDFKPLKGNPKPPSTHEIDAWADQDAKRIYGHFEGDVFVLDCLDKALH